MLWPFPFNHYPGTDYETFNWDWLISTYKKLQQGLNELFTDTGALHQMVDKVLGEHPEWTTTVMDGVITPAKFSQDTIDMINRTARSAVNVLSLGVDNTGVTDCSTILNDYDENLPLYFPAGTYKVDSTVNIKTSWYGAGCVRGAYGNNEYTSIRLGNNAILTGYDVTGSIVLDNFDVYKVAGQNAIHLQSNGSTVYYTIHEISVHNVAGGDAVKCEGLYNFASRAFNIDGLYLFSKGISYRGRGLFFTGLTGDNVIDNVEIMKFCTGVEFSSFIYRIGKIHIWNGTTSDDVHTQADDEATRSIITNTATTLMCDNVYTDTAHIAIVLNQASYVSIANYTHRDDGTLSNAGHLGTMVYYTSPRTGKIDINSMDIVMPSIWTGLGTNEGSITVDNLNMNYNNQTLDYRYFMFNDGLTGKMETTMPTNADTYQPLMVVTTYNKGYISADISYFTGEKDRLEMALSRSGGTLTVRDASSTRTNSAGGSATQYPLYYKVQGAVAIIYSKLSVQDSAWNEVITVHTYNDSANAVPITCLHPTKTTNAYETLRTTDATGMVAIT